MGHLTSIFIGIVGVIQSLISNLYFSFILYAAAMNNPAMAAALQNAAIQAAGAAAGAGINPQQVAALQAMQQQQMLQAQQIQAALSGGRQLTAQELQTLQMMMMIQRNQQIIQQTQQQLLVAQPTGTTAAGNQLLQQYQVAAAARANATDGPPAKRQAIDANQQAQMLASHQFRQLHAAGGLSHMSPPQHTQLYQTLLARARQHLGLPAIPVQNAQGRSNMRVSVDKRNKSAGDKLFQAEDTTGRDHADEVVRRCEEISKALRARLGKGTKDAEGRFGGTDFDTQVQITQSEMIEACGDTARYLKPYQIVGVNFLMLLYRTQVGGGEKLLKL